MSAIERLEPLTLAIEEGRPLVLLLGQSAWSAPTRPDAALVAALKRTNRFSDNSLVAGFPALLQAPLSTEFYGWLAEFYDRQPTPEWTESVAALPWSAVFTTSIDPTINRVFRNHGREVEGILMKEDSPIVPRNRHRLHITYLFGKAGEPLGNGAPPVNTTELRKRTMLHATSLLARTLDTTTPLGILVVDGFKCGSDWLSTEILVGVLSAFRPRQVFWFGWDSNAMGSADRQLIQEFVESDGPVVFFRERLATAIKELDLTHRIDLGKFVRGANEATVSIGEGSLQLSAATRLKTATGATIIDDTCLSPLSPLGQDAEYAEFHRFHGNVEDARQLIEGLRRNFSIKRQFEATLADRVRGALNSASRAKEPILIHGQSGSGKSLALARLAYEVRCEKQFPVLLASRTLRVPAVNELDEFCLLAEDAGATATLIICDANAPLGRYSDLLSGFMSRGRRVVVVGSAYRIVDASAARTYATNDSLLEVPTELSEVEQEELLGLLRRFFDDKLRLTGSEYLLPAIYRMLPDARPRLASGLAKEARVTEEILRTQGKREASSIEAVGQLAQAMFHAGLLTPKQLLEDQIEEFLGCMSDSATRAIDYVMLPGKLGCFVPIDLLMRAVGGSDDRTDIGTLFGKIDLFRWSSNEQDDIFIHPRLRLEAELICARRLGTVEAEAEVAIRLLNFALPSSYRGNEKRFVSEFVHRLGSDGPYGSKYARFYLKIARALTELRRRTGFSDASFMLQEASLRRHFIRECISFPSACDSAVVLEEAREIVDSALNEFEGSQSQNLKRICTNLKVERAAIYGFRATERVRQGATREEVWQFYLASRESARSAANATDAYYPVDVCLWVASDLLEKGEWSEEQRAELIADIWDALERVDSDQLNIEQREKYEKRRFRVSQILNDKELQRDSLDSLCRSGSCAGFLLHARSIAELGLGCKTPDEAQIKRSEEAAVFLEKHWEQIRNDTRCLMYLLRCRWLTSTRTFIFGGERAPLPTENKYLSCLLNIVDQLRFLEGAFGDTRVLYLQAVLLWRLGRVHDALELWSELSRQTEYSDPRRVVRHHVWSETEGKPRLFYGRIVNERSENGRFRVRVEEINQDVELLQRDFQDMELRRGASIPGGFYIAFNYIGPVADKPRKRG